MSWMHTVRRVVSSRSHLTCRGSWLTHAPLTRAAAWISFGVPFRDPLSGSPPGPPRRGPSRRRSLARWLMTMADRIGRPADRHTLVDAEHPFDRACRARPTRACSPRPALPPSPGTTMGSRSSAGRSSRRDWVGGARPAKPRWQAASPVLCQRCAEAARSAVRSTARPSGGHRVRPSSRRRLGCPAQESVVGGLRSLATVAAQSSARVSRMTTR